MLLTAAKDGSVIPSSKYWISHGFFKGRHIPLGKSGVAIVLVHMGSTELVKREIPPITTVVQGLEGQEDISDHGVHLVPPKEIILEGMPSLTPILLVCEFLDVLPRA